METSKLPRKDFERNSYQSKLNGAKNVTLLKNFFDIQPQRERDTIDSPTEAKGGRVETLVLRLGTDKHLDLYTRP